MAMNLWKVSAGDGYTYLTRQVARFDTTEPGREGLASYYSERGERPGVWMGSGLAGLGMVAGETVTDAQMKALFGEGLHPDADRFVREAVQAGVSPEAAVKGAQLGQRYRVVEAGASLFEVEVARRLAAVNAARGVRSRAAVDPMTRARVRSEVAAEFFEREYGRAPLNARELAGYVTRVTRPPAQPCAGFDLTFTVPKSVSVLWAVADRGLAERIEEAHRGAIRESMEWLEEQVAFTRRGKGGVRQVEVRGLVAAAFEHRDSRDGDPHLHTHVAVANKVQAAEDGAWLSLDGRMLYRAAVAASELYDLRLTARLEALGLVTEPVRSPESRAVTREVVGVSPRLMEAWSSRHAAIEARAAVLAAEFVEAAGRPPTPGEAMALKRQAHLDTRQEKHEPRSLREQRDQWLTEAEAVLGRGGVAVMLAAVAGARSGPRVDVSLDELVDRTVSAVEGSRSVFGAAHVTAAAAREVRAAGVDAGRAEAVAAEVTRAVLGDRVVRLTRPDVVREPSVLRRADGSSVYEVAWSQAAFTTQRILDGEARLLGWAQRTDGRVVDDTAVDLALLESVANGVQLNAGQAAMVRSMAGSGCRAQLALAPAGSGKTTSLRVLGRAWEGSGGTVLGLAPSAAAAAELRAATGIRSDTIDKVLWHLRHTPEDLPEWVDQVDEGTLVIVDEAGMATTVDLDLLVSFVVGRGGSVRLVGDDQQLAAVGAGGALRDLAQLESTVTLTELMRFTDPAEAAATLAARDGSPAAIGFWLDRDRVHPVPQLDAVETVFRAWQADVDAGRQSLMIAGTRELVARLNDRAREERVTRAGGEEGPAVTLRTGSRATAGDLIVTRRNDRRLAVSATDWVKNGDRWLVHRVHAGGAVTAEHLTSHLLVTLPAEYVAESVELGYAVTVHGAQGATADTCHVALTGSEDRQTLYVATSRGRRANELYVLVGGSGDEHDRIRPEVVHPATAVETLERILGRDGAQRSATSTLVAERDPGVALHRAVAIYNDAVDHLSQQLLGDDWQERMHQAAEQLVPGITAAPAWSVLLGHLARVELDEQDPVDALTRAVAVRELGTGVDAAAVLDWRLDTTGRHHGRQGPLPWLPSVPVRLAEQPEIGTYLEARADQIRSLAEEVAEATAGDPATWQLPYLGQPDLVRELAVWRAAYGVVDTEVPGPVTGRPLPASRAGRYQQQLEQRAMQARHDTTVVDVDPLIRQRQVLGDPWWPVLAHRLGLAQAAGVDIAALLDEHQRAPLPDEHAAAALWYRLAPTLAPATITRTGSRLRPAWARDLARLLGDDAVAERVFVDPQWPALVATVDEAVAAGIAPVEVLAPAVAWSRGVDPDDRAAVLAHTVRQLLHPPADVDPGDASYDETALAAYLAETADAPAAEEPPPDPYGDREPVPPTEPVVLPEPVGTPVERIIELNEQAAAIWAAAYQDSPAAAYMAARFGGTVLDQVGYADAGWDTLTTQMRAAGATDAELVDAGLAKWSRRGTLIDVFRDRVVLPVHDEGGQLVGFIGRCSPGAGPDVPKYLNTPSTAAFGKGRVLYGLHENRAALNRGATPVICEGVFDAVAVTAAGGGDHVGVAPLGTALTDAQVAVLARTSRTTEVIVATDTDQAGREAAVADYWRLAARGLTGRRLVLAPGIKDPAEQLQADPAWLAAALKHSDVGPSLTFVAVAARVAPLRSRLEEGNAALTVAAAREVGRIIAAAPAEQWAGEIDAAAEHLAGMVGQDDDLRTIIGYAVIAAAIDWDPVDLEAGGLDDDADPTTRARLARIHADLVDHAHSTPLADPALSGLLGQVEQVSPPGTVRLSATALAQLAALRHRVDSAEPALPESSVQDRVARILDRQEPPSDPTPPPVDLDQPDRGLDRTL